MNNITDIYDYKSFGDISDSDGKKQVQNLDNNPKELVTDVREFPKLIEERKKLLSKIAELEKEGFIFHTAYHDRINVINFALLYGIKIDDNILGGLKDLVIKFCTFLGIDPKLIEKKKEIIDKIDLTVSPVKLESKGELVNCGDFISIDYSYAEFDEEGKFVKLNEPEKDFFKHTLIHELLHSISREFDFVSNYMDSFSEGMTDYFALKISKSSDNASKKYHYAQRFFYLLGIMIGDDALFEDYATNLSTMPNLTNFINSLGITREEFSKFKKVMDLMLVKSFEKNRDETAIGKLREQTDAFIFNRIVMPYCNNDKDAALALMERAFSNSEEVKRDVCEVHFNENGKRNKHSK